MTRQSNNMMSSWKQEKSLLFIIAFHYCLFLKSSPIMPLQLGTIQMSTGTHALVLQARGIEDLPKGMCRLLETSSIFKCAVNIGMDASMLRERCVHFGPC